MPKSTQPSDKFRSIPLGWVPDLPDHRDKWYRDIQGFKSFKLPQKVDLRAKFGPVNDQGPIGSCTAQAASDALEYLDRVAGRQVFDYSRLFIYYNSRKFKDNDTGAYIRDVFKSLATFGACREKLWPYDIKSFAKKPVQKAFEEAEKHQAIEYMRVKQGNELRQVLAEGFPVEFGMTIHQNFYDTGKNGKVPAPKGPSCGGHAMLLVGYDMIAKEYIIRNSYGTDWGANGYGFVSFDVIDNPQIATDLWVVRSMESGDDNKVALPTPPPTPRPASSCQTLHKLKAKFVLGSKD